MVLHVTWVETEFFLDVLGLGEVEKDGSALVDWETVEAIAGTSGQVKKSWNAIIYIERYEGVSLECLEGRG